jgi:hypothetical protein
VAREQNNITLNGRSATPSVKQIGPEMSAPFFSDLNNLPSAQQKHSKSQTHVYSYPQLKLFGKQ